MSWTEGNEELWKRKNENGVLIAAHKGTSGGNVIQNTSLAYMNSLLHGADMIEIDVILSTDGVFYAFHDGQEPFLLRINKDIKKMTSTEIDSYTCINQNGAYSKQHLEKLDDILEQFKGRCFINIDRSWFYWKEIIEFLDKKGMQDQIILKSPVEKDLLETLQNMKSSVMYMPILKTVEEWDIVKQYDINVVAAELIFKDLSSPFIKPEFIEGLHKENIMAWANAITLDDNDTLTGLLDDNRAIKEGYDASWGKLLNLGFDIIQTDWPALLKQYTLSKNA